MADDVEEASEAPQLTQPSCITCRSKKSLLWKRNINGDFTCRGCIKRQAISATTKRTRKNTRSKSARNRQAKTAKEVKVAKGRRTMFKKRPQRALSTMATIVTTECLVYKGQYYRSGTIVSLANAKGEVRYGQIYGLAVDEFGEKSAFITWLRRRRGEGIFHPGDFALDEVDDCPRKLSHLTFISQAPVSLFNEHFYPSGSKCFIKDKSVSKEMDAPSNLIQIHQPLLRTLRKYMR